MRKSSYGVEQTPCVCVFQFFFVFIQGINAINANIEYREGRRRDRWKLLENFLSSGRLPPR
jgi:hypothetical protein